MGKVIQSANNAGVLSFANQQTGQLVGNGQCWDLAEEALMAASAKTSNDIMGWKNVTATADYKWGTLINKNDLMPGDIIQFRNYKYTMDSGESQTRPHHTAIVSAVWYYGTIDVIEQNVPKGSAVSTNTLYLTSGSYDGVVITVTGKFWCYRPVSKP